MDIVKASIQTYSNKKDKKRNKIDHIFLTWCEYINDKIILAEKTGRNSSLSNDYIRDIFQNFMWNVRCCEDTNVVQEAYNTMHVIGMLACKATYYLIISDNNHENETMVTLFPTLNALHITSQPILSVSFKTLSSLVVSMQVYWKRLLTCESEAAIQCLLLLIARFGYFILYCTEQNMMDEQECREGITGEPFLFRPTKRSIRNLVTTFLVLLRTYSIHNHARDCLLIDTHKKIKVRSKDLDDIHLNIHEIICKIQDMHHNTRTDGHVNKIDTYNPSDMWARLNSKEIGCTIGKTPLYIKGDLSLIVQTVYRAWGDIHNTGHVTDDIAKVINTALEIYYITCSADLFRTISVVEDILPGQRLNYAFDYMFFDTGQLSQVVYLHNPMYKMPRTPMSCSDWHRNSNIGPIVSFCQIAPDLVLFLDDCEDPLGVLGQYSEIRRPKDYNSQVKTNGKIVHEWRLVINCICVYLVNTKTLEVFRPPTDDALLYHPAIYLLSLYVCKTNKFQDLASIAINSVRTQSNNSENTNTQ